MRRTSSGSGWQRVAPSSGTGTSRTRCARRRRGRSWPRSPDVLDGRCLTRDELVEAATPHVSGWAREHIGSGWGTVLGPAALNGVLVHGPPQGTRVTFVRPDQWFGAQQEWEPRAALVEILRRYLRAFGPATHNHFADWVAGSHLKAKDAKALLDSIAGELVEVEIEGKQRLAARGRPKPLDAGRRRSSDPRVRRLRDGLPRARAPLSARGSGADEGARERTARRAGRALVAPRRRRGSPAPGRADAPRKPSSSASSRSGS